MSRFEWRPFLEQYSREMIADPRIRSGLPPEIISFGWLGCPPASEAQLATLESRLGVALAPSYRQFLATTNGWRATGYFVWEVWPTDKVDWFRAANQSWIDAYVEPARDLPPLSDEDYLVYGAAQNAAIFRREYLQTALQLSGRGDDAVYLLNPKTQSAAGEWEAWFFASWSSGAVRYRSFLGHDAGPVSLLPGLAPAACRRA
jgi:hypothetical protein